MATKREIALEQALVAAFHAAKSLGLDHFELYEKSKELIQRNSRYVELDYPHVADSRKELAGAWEQFIAIPE
ncbi:hypothetical protein [Pseudomonas rustica]|uniref:hypothetical protein n=1 Tax=Pseudomonas rustica TaxID=2827099 RepID=UPI001BAEFB4E|nr:hypothetical protein [Pseudomonas rustica]MBS4090762.1 hypothetical protein [Pseudomonas rustica]